MIGVAFCTGALTALWAERPWEHRRHAEDALSRVEDVDAAGSAAGAVGTYGESEARMGDRRPEESRDAIAPAPPLPPESANARPEFPAAVVPEVPENGATLAAELRDRHLLIPVQGIAASALHPTFHAQRGTREHEALDILADRGTPVIAADDGRIEKLFYSERGGKTIYQFDTSGRYCYYYAHLDRYAPSLAEKQPVARGEVIGYVGSTGNADEATPHLHFAILRLGPDKRWWQGTPIDPFPALTQR